MSDPLKEIAALSVRARTEAINAIELMWAAKLAVKGINDDGDHGHISFGIGRLLNDISESIDRIETAHIKILNMTKESANV